MRLVLSSARAYVRLSHARRCRSRRVASSAIYVSNSVVVHLEKPAYGQTITDPERTTTKQRNITVRFAGEGLNPAGTVSNFTWSVKPHPDLQPGYHPTSACYGSTGPSVAQSSISASDSACEITPSSIGFQDYSAQRESLSNPTMAIRAASDPTPMATRAASERPAFTRPPPSCGLRQCLPSTGPTASQSCRRR